MAEETKRSTTSDGVLEERQSSPGLLLALLGQEAMRRLRATHTALGLSPRQYLLLGLLHDHGPIGQRELGHTMDVDPSILVTLLNPLEASGFVSRVRDHADRRRHLVTLTANGKRRLKTATRLQREIEDELFAGLDGDELQHLTAALVALRDTLADAPDVPCTTPRACGEC